MSASSSTIADVSAPSIAATAAPVSASPTGVAPLPRDANRCTPNVATSAPISANHTVAPTESATPNCRPSTTANAAPELTPKMPGSANALRVWPCINAPAMPRQAPISTATTVRGNRRLRTITSASEPSFAVRACHNAPGPNQREPSARPAANASTRITTRASSAAVRRTDGLALGRTVDGGVARRADDTDMWLGLPYL